MTSGDSKQAEKEYLARTGSSAWERSKPFSPPGSDTLPESAMMLHDFAVSVLALQPAPDDRILDLGAGACWVSDLLGRLNRQVIAVDIAVDMLRAGRARPGSSIRAAAGDLESLPFQSGTFQKAICLSAIHHVPNIRKALGEVSRVLDRDGVALFSEPGKGHADSAVATTAVRDFGVLEQDILVEPFIRHCHEAGFERVTVRPSLHSVPGVDLTLEQWNEWSRLAASKRPQRALAKMAFAAAELFGLGKRGPLFEEAMAVAMVRTVRQLVEHHPMIVAAKSSPQAAAAGQQWRAAFEQPLPTPILTDGRATMTVTAVNAGTRTWRMQSASGIGHVTLGVQLLDGDGRMIGKDHHRVRLSNDVPPAQRVSLAIDCPVPREPGRYGLKFDFVAEGVTWFETAGSTAAAVTVEVGGRQ